MNTYFFSERTPDPEMLKDLGDSITTQFKDTISDIHRRSKQIVFTENRRIWGHQIMLCHMILAESLVVVDGPILLQDAWLNAGVATLLIPQMKQEASKWGSILFKYCDLLQVHRIEVVTSQWTNTNHIYGEKSENRMTSTPGGYNCFEMSYCLKPSGSYPQNSKDVDRVASTVVAQKSKESFQWVLTAFWVAIFTCLAVGLRLKQPSSPQIRHSIFRFLEDVQPRRPSLNLSLTSSTRHNFEYRF